MTALKPLWIGIAAFVIAFLAYLAWISTHEKIWYDRPLPTEGEATYNDYFVVQQALRAQGVRVESMPHLQGLETWSGRDSLLLGSDTRTLSPQQVDALLAWVARGGRLLVATGSGNSDVDNGLLERIGVAASDTLSCFRLIHASKERPGTACMAGVAIREDARAKFEVAIGDAHHRWVLARRSWGRGLVEVIGSLEPLQLNELDPSQSQFHAYRESEAWAWQILAPVLPEGGVLHIVYQSELPPLYVYLVRYGWYALLPLLFALSAWLWAGSQRFGPAIPLPAPDRRALGEHIVASGEFLYRRGLVDVLHAPLRRRLDESLRRRDPELAALPEDEIVRILAQRHRLAPDVVRQALQPPQPKQRKAFLATVQTLLQLIRNP